MNYRRENQFVQIMNGSNRAEASGSFNSRSESDVLCAKNVAVPLTPALAPGKRETRTQSPSRGRVLRNQMRSQMAKNRTAILPLPKGEGRGEGERIAINHPASSSGKAIHGGEFSRRTGGPSR